MNKLVIGTRGSRLALAQANEVREQLLSHWPDLETEIRIIKTQGDKRLDLSLSASGDKGLFTKELEFALEQGEIDCAVHSLKDLPVELTSGTCLGAILKREEVNDVLISPQYKTLQALPLGAIVGTSSPRRAAQLLEQRPDLDIRDIRGNVETRLSKLKSGGYDALVMALAGLKRLGLDTEATQVFNELEMVPASGQAAIAVQLLSRRDELRELFSPIHDANTARCTEIERLLLTRLGGGCAIPFGCYCSLSTVTDVESGGREYPAYFITVYNCNDPKVSLKTIVASVDASLDDIWEQLQADSIPISRERFN